MIEEGGKKTEKKVGLNNLQRAMQPSRPRTAPAVFGARYYVALSTDDRGISDSQQPCVAY